MASLHGDGPHLRSEFELPDNISYLNCAFLSPLLKAVRTAADQGLNARSRPWEVTTNCFFDDAEESRRLFAGIIGGDPEGVAIVPSVSYAMSIAAKNLDLPSGSKILLPEGEFPSNVYVWRELAKLKGLQIEVVPAPADFDWTRAVLERLDRSVSLVTVPPCHWCDGASFDLKAIGKRCRELGAKFIIDGSQALGTFPVQVAEWDPDYLMCVGYKWLLGPYGVSFLYVAERNRQGSPIEFGWLNRKGAEDFSRLCEYTDDFMDGARRFDFGSRGNMILLPMMNAALGKLLEWGLPRIQSNIQEIAGQLERMLTAAGATVVPANRRMAHIVGVRTPHAKALAGHLGQKGVLVSARHHTLRISPHVYNDQSDVEKLLAYLPTESFRSNSVRLPGPKADTRS